MGFSTVNLNRWYLKARRDLPWRRNPTPYFVWISEIMLQQTQVKTALPYYERFMRRFPTIESLARASESEVLEHWSGLGYYSRARNLHKTAQIVQEKFGGRFPETQEEILKLPGIGPYTAGALLSISYHKAVPLVDGNVKRILSRYFLETSESAFWEIARDLVLRAETEKIDPSNHNQALMELGALICLPEQPICSSCPLEDSCLAKKESLQHLYPPKRKKNETVHQSHALFVVTNGNRVLLRQRSQKERWFKGMWEFPMISVDSVSKADLRKLEKEFSKKTGYSIRVNSMCRSFNHSITHHRLKIWPLRCGFLSQKEKEKENGFEWIHKNKISTLSSSSMLTKTLALCGEI